MKKIISIALLGIVSFASAQVGMTNSGNIQIFGGASINVVSNFINNANGTFINNGNLYLRSNVTNNEAAMAVGSGTIYLNGTVTQTVSGSQVLKTFNLTTANAAGFILNNDLLVKGVHIFNAGIITTSVTPNYMIYDAGSIFWMSNDTRHINGWVKKLGNTNFNFPVGNGTYVRHIALNNLTATGEFNVKYNGPVTPNYTSLFDPLVLVDTSEYWTINRVSGTAGARVVMNWDNNKVPFPNLMLSDIRVAKYDSTDFWRNIGGTATGNPLTTGTITSNSVSVFNDKFTLGSLATILPVKIISFTAARMKDFTKLNWIIGNEINVDNYELERSDDGINFYTIYTHAPYNRNGTEFYSYDDSKILKGTAFYRLKVNNLSTQVNYSHIVTVSVNDNGKSFYVITNPVDASIELYADAAVKGIYNYTLANTSGQLMQSGKLEIPNAGIYSIHLRSVFAKGAYILVVQNENNKLQKIIIKK